MYYEDTKVGDILDELGMSDRDVKNALGRAKGRINRAKKE